MISVVPNEETAIKIAEQKWLEVYGDGIESKKPFVAVLEGDSVWHVFGTLPQSGWRVTPQGDSIIDIIVGGVPHAWIRKSDGVIKDITHGK